MKIDPAFRHYPITEKLDERGMDAVYAVKDTSLKPPVLLKSLLSGYKSNRINWLEIEGCGSLESMS